MTIASLPLFRSVTTLKHRIFPHIPTIRHLSTILCKHPEQQNVSRKPSKNLLKAKRTFKQYSTLAPVLSPDTKLNLTDSQAIGQVAAAQANFMRVIVQTLNNRKKNDNSVNENDANIELLCVVKAVLKKIKRRVMVGDKVVVGSIDWIDRRGMIENVFERSSEILDPPVANVDHLLVLFSMEQPKIEPFVLTRFLIEAESTNIPLTLALNKCELVDDQTLDSWKSRLHTWGYEPVFCSVESKHGLDNLASILRNQTSVIVGPSGTGKSSLINALRNNPQACDASKDDN